MIRRFLTDRQGTSLVTYTLVLPILLLLVFGAGTMWQIISIRHSVSLATYEAARFLSRTGREWASDPFDPEAWRERAYQEVYPFIDAQIRRNPFIAEEDNIEVEIHPPLKVDCRQMPPGWTDLRRPEEIRFTVITRVTVQAPFRTPFLPDIHLTLQEAYDDVIECPRDFLYLPDEGNTY